MNNQPGLHFVGGKASTSSTHLTSNFTHSSINRSPLPLTGMLKYFPAWSLLLALLIPVAAAFTSTIWRSKNNDQLRDLLMMPDAAADINDGNNNGLLVNHHQRNIVVLCHNISQDVVDGIFDVNNLTKGRIDVLARCVTSALWISNKIRTDTNLFLMLSPHNITIEVQGSLVRSLTPDERTMALYLQRTLWCGKDDCQRKGGQDASSSSAAAVSDSFIANNSETPGSTSKYINPQSAPMPKEKMIRDMRKGRDALIQRIRIAHHGKSPLPGFVMHHEDTLQARLKKLSSFSSGDDGRHDIWMMSETGDPLWQVLEDQEQQQPKCAANIDRTTTTLILGNQLGYSADDEKLLRGTEAVREVSLGNISLLTSQCITITHHYLDRLYELERSNHSPAPCKKKK